MHQSTTIHATPISPMTLTEIVANENCGSQLTTMSSSQALTLQAWTGSPLRPASNQPIYRKLKASDRVVPPSSIYSTRRSPRLRPKNTLAQRSVECRGVRKEETSSDRPSCSEGLIDDHITHAGSESRPFAKDVST